MTDIHAILKEYWGYPAFRPLQEDIIRTVLDGKDCLALLPTGGGKSLCFQVPALAKPGLCLVISPLIALMKDQVENLRKKNITAFSIHSGLNRNEVLNTLAVASHSNCKFLYVSPERLETKVFREYLLSLGISLIAVDEAHCISQWGYDFRPSYTRIAALRDELPGIPILALTASATAIVQQDVCEKLHFHQSAIFRQSFERPNLSYSAFDPPSKVNKVVEILSKVQGSGIVYCRSRKRTKEISDLLRQHTISADYYHAGLDTEQRNQKQEAWLKNETRVIVCTNAFGMGIDKPDVRVVIHADLPDCLENYYQEAGRAGRDGKRSYAVLLFQGRETRDLKLSVQSRFPALEDIRKIYHDLMNHLQLAAGTGEGQRYELDLAHFVKQFSLKNATTVSVLKTLEQEGLLYFNEQLLLPSKLQVTGSREALRQFEQEYPTLEPALKTLLRTYEGILDQAVPVYEKQMAAALKTTAVQIGKHLNRMHQYGIVQYSPQQQKPLIVLQQNRSKADDLQINMDDYRKRKQQYEERTATIIRYAYTKTACRSAFIGNYFGDRGMRACGICDNCIDRKKRALAQKEFAVIHARVLHIAATPVSISEMTAALEGVTREKTLEVVKYLEAENKLSISSEGLICAV